jgi:hypothetical protein
MAARTGLQESLKEITALMGLLRSDLIELSEARLDGARRSPVVSHMRWIADRFDELAPALAVDAGRRPAPTTRRKATTHKASARPARKVVAPATAPKAPPKADAAAVMPAAHNENAPLRLEPERDQSAEPDRPDPDATKPISDAG